MQAIRSYNKVISKIHPIKYAGRIERIRGDLIEGLGPVAEIGELCRIPLARSSSEIYGEVVSLENHRTRIMLFASPKGMRTGDEIIALGHRLEVPVSDNLLGRVIDPLIRPLDGGAAIKAYETYPVMGEAPRAMDRPPVSEQLAVGIRAIDGLLPLGMGQRVGIFSGSGVGKSTLLGMIARNTQADVVVIALIGERGREVREFIDNDLGAEGLKRSVLVVSTSDSPPLARIRGAYTATAISEYFRDQGKNVLLLFDSITRFATAGREIGLSIGEVPTTRGYTPSVFNMLPKLIERAGRTESGSITAIYNVLVEGDDLDEPVADTTRGILDGHIVLSRSMAERYHFPAIDIPASVSRLVTNISSIEKLDLIASIRSLISVYKEREDLIEIGAYAEGSNRQVDLAISKIENINKFLCQSIKNFSSVEETEKWMTELL